MNDLETRLRATLTARAGDITTLPAALLDLDAAPADPVDHDEVLDLGAARAARRARSVRWLALAAAAAVVLLAVGVAQLGGRDRRSAPPPATQSTTPTPTPTPTPTAAGQAPASTVGLVVPAGWRATLRASEPGRRLVTLRAAADPDFPYGCNGCEAATDYASVFEAGAFHAHTDGWAAATVAGHPARLGRMSWIGVGKHVVRTLAWQFAPGRWAVVQGVTALGERTSTLELLAAALRPTVDAPIPVPFRFGFVPDLPLTSVTDDRSEGYSLTVTLSSADGRTFDVTTWPHAPSTVTHTAAHRTVVGGQIGWYDRTAGVLDVPYRGGWLELGISESAGAPTYDSLPLTAQDRADMDRVVAGLTFTNGDGSAPYLPLEQAVP